EGEGAGRRRAPGARTGRGCGGGARSLTRLPRGARRRPGGANLKHRHSVLDREGHALAHDTRHQRRGEAAAQQVVAQARGGPRAVAPRERRKPSAGGRAGALELARVVAAGPRGRDQRSANAARPELRAQARRAVAARATGGDPVAGEGRVVEIAAGGEVGDHVVGDGRRRAAPSQARGEIARGPGAAGQEVGGNEPRGPRVEDSARTARTRYDLLKKELPAGETGDGARSLVRCSKHCPPLRKMPRTFRSKSVALGA